MILILDLGNTNLYIGVYQNENLIKEYRTDSDVKRSLDMYESLLRGFLTSSGFKESDFEGAILSSVIPQLTYQISGAVERIIKKECLIVGRDLKSGLIIHSDNPTEVGADLVCDCVGANAKYGYPSIICDLGTANKLLICDKQGIYCGAVISPGLVTAQKALSNDAAQLFDISFKAPKKVIGRNTPDCLNSGAIYGTVAAIEGLTEMIEKELGYRCNHILTGGNAVYVHQYLKNYTYDPTLILYGLLKIYLKNTKEKKL